MLQIAAQSPLASLEYHISGASLRVTPSVLSVPKNIAGSVLVELTGGSNAVPAGAFVEATLRGPSFPARRVLGQVNQALLLPPLPLVGDYQLDGIRMVRVEGTNTVTLQEGVPSSVPIRVFDEVLVSRVTSRPLSLDEIRGKGIAIDDKNFRAVEFEVGFVLDGKTIPVRFPVVAPAFAGNTEIIPAAELQARLAQAEAINNQLDLGTVLPPELETAQLNLDIKGINFQVVEEGDQDLALSIPPIPALMVVPGNVGFLNQFFSVQIFTENAAPQNSGLSVVNVQARLKLPPGPDLVVSTNYNEPGDDPLRFARVGPDRVIQPVQPIVRPGADGRTGTGDDVPRLLPGETGTGEFLVEGLQEGLHVMDLDLTADLEGLAGGIVKIKGKAAGSVLVRNPKFSLAFSHPRTVRAGEPYDLYVSILNTSGTVANLVQVAMAAASVSGGVLESPETVVLGTILPGQTQTAKFRVRPTRTGAISFSNLTTSDDSLVGRFRLRGGFDERGVALSPDTIALPNFVTNLPPALVDAANRVLGQALGVATAGQVPPGVKPVGRSVITRRALELAEAGQRVQYGDPLERVLSDLLLDWQGGRTGNDGFDQILRETDAGREWREAIALHQDGADGLDAVTRLARRLPDLAGRGEPWAIFALDSENGSIRLNDTAPAFSGGGTNESTSAPRYDHTNAATGLWWVTRPGTNVVFEWRPATLVARAELAFAILDTNGTAQHFRWSVSNLAARACVRFAAADASGQLQIDANCDGTAESVVAAAVTVVRELPPALVSVRQDPTVVAGRPGLPCVPAVPGFPMNYGTVLAVLFSKPMTQDRVDLPSAYALENGNTAGSVQIQPGGRVALLNMRLPVGALRQRTMTVSRVTDARGNELGDNVRPVISDLRSGVAVRGRVARGDGSPAAGLPVTLTYYDRYSTPFECPEWIVRPVQVFTDEEGYFDFDYVMSGIAYSISATDTLGLSPEAIGLILESTRADEFQRSKLLELANSASGQNTLLGAFAVGALTDVVAKAEGLDRALLRDLVELGSAREGTEVPVALRFRGRGVVAGRVVAADGITPVSRAAVNLFPDPASRELGRGLFSDSDGRFAFFGVPLGTFSIEAVSGTGLNRTVAGVLDRPGQSTNLVVALSSAQVARTDLTGRVTEADNATPHPGATVFVGQFTDQGFRNVVAAVPADADGFWRAAGVPANDYDVVAVSLDGRRKGERRNISAPAGVTNFAAIALQGFGVVIGRVETAAGIPVVNAIVAGGEQLVRTTNNGFFRLTGVPTGLRNVSAGVERSRAGELAKSTPAFSFPRLGSAQVNVLPGVENFVVIRLEPKGSLIGRVVDETGTNAVSGINVAIPDQNGFLWVPVNPRGEFVFEGIPLKKYTLSAPAPPVFNTDVGGILDVLGNSRSSEGELQAAIGEAFAIFTGAADPLLNGEGAAFNPNRWGYVETELSGDGEVRNVTVQFFRSSTIAGKVINGQGVPIGARVRLTGIGAAANGGPTTLIRGELNSDPALGTFRFERAAFIGSYGLQTASPFFPVVVTASGFTTEVQPDDTNIVLQFPSARDVNGRLVGTVLNPDGTPVGSNVNVKISFGNNFVIKTRGDGTFDTQIGLPATDLQGSPGLGYFVEADDPATGARGAASVIVFPGNTNVANNFVNVRLLGRGALRVTVLENDGRPAAGASLGYAQGNYPNDAVPMGAGPVADARGQALFQNLFEGSYSACARFVAGPVTLRGTAGATVERGKTNEVIIRLGPTATIEGRFVKRDLVTPVGFAQVAVGTIGFATTDSNGFFRVVGLPLGSYRLTSSDPVTGIGAVLNTTLSFDGQTNVVRLVEQSRGEIRGAVIASDGISFAPGVNVTLSVSDGITPSRSVTTGPDGRFSFPGAPAGPFALLAQHPLTALAGANSATLPEGASSFEINVALEPLGAVSIRVLRPDSFTPATNASVALGELSADTDGEGRVRFSDLRLGGYLVTAASRSLAETRSIQRTNLTLAVPGPAPEVVLVLRGVGAVEGRVFLSDGVTPAAGAEVRLTMAGPIVRDTLVTGVDGAGRFVISNVAVGPYQVGASVGPLGARVAGEITVDGERDLVTLTVEPSGVVRGRLVRADGVTPVAGEDVNLTLPGRSLPGALFRTGADGRFGFTSVPLGVFRLQSTAVRFNGIALRESVLAVNGQTNDVGNLVMDEDDPRVVGVFPPDTSTGVPITTRIELVFNEALRSNTVDATGVYLQGPGSTVPAGVQLLDHSNGVARLVRLTPVAPLKSLTTYRVVVVDNERRDALGGIIGRGPQDLVGRPLVAPFLSTFTTADNDPPVLVSIFPTNGQIQIDPRAVLRLSFNEPIRETNLSFALTGPNGLVAGTAGVGLNGLALAFAPAAELAPNTTYTLVVSNVFDLAGNRATNEPFVATFTTLDTLGPEIVSLAIVGTRPPVAGSFIELEALLAGDEPGASVRFTRDLNAAGSDTNAPFRVGITLPQSGSTTVRAIATDRFGNDGPLAELVINVLPNQPPAVTLTRVSPAAGPVFRDEPFTVRVTGTDDAGVTNLAIAVTGSFNLVTNVPGPGPADVTFLLPFSTPTGSVITVTARAADFAGLLSAEASLNLVVSNLNRRPVAGVVQLLPRGALELDGIDDQAFGPRFLDVANDFTMELWVNPTASHRITSELNLGAEAQGGMRYAIFPVNGVEFGGGSHAGAGISIGTNGVSVAEHASGYIPTLLVHPAPVIGWTHVAVVYSNRIPTLYVNGAFARQGLASTRDVHPSAGISEFVPYGAYRGQVDEVRVWRTTRTAREIRETMNVRLAGTEPGLVAYFRFDQTDGGQVQNAVANGDALVMGTAPGRPLRVASAAPVMGGAIRTNTSLSRLALSLDGFDPDNDLIAAVVTVLPLHGVLFQTADGINPGERITSVPSPVTDVGRRVIFRRQPGYTGPDEFAYVLNDGGKNSAEALVLLDLVTPLELDTDGDGMPDIYEVANGLDPDLNDGPLDLDGDGLNNLGEFLAGTDPRKPDTDGDGIRDGQDPNPLEPSDALRPTVLTFNVAGLADFQNIDQGYGDRVTNNVMGGFSYGGFRPFTPNVTVSYGTGDPALWTTGYGSLTNVLFEDQDNTGVLTVTLAADEGVLARLHGFKLAAFGTTFTSDPVVSRVEVLDGGANVLFAATNLAVSRATFTSLNFTSVLSSRVLTIRVDARNLGFLNDDIAIDDIRFSQVGALGCVPLPAGALAWWPGNDSAGDAVGGVPGVLENGAGFVDGLVGRTFSFDGTDDQVLLGANLFRPTNAFTYTFWTQIPAGGGGHAFGAGASGGQGFGGVNVGSNRFQFLWTPSSPVADALLSAVDAPIAPGVWAHLAVSVDFGRQTYAMYVDGQPVTATLSNQIGQAITNWRPDGSFNQGRADTIGGRFVNSPLFFRGLLDELVVYDRVLSSAEIASIHAAGAEGFCARVCAPLPAGVVGWWPAENTPHDLVAGESGALRNGAAFTNAGLVGAAFLLDGVDDFVDIGPLAALDDAAEITVTAWVNRRFTDNSVAGIVGKWDSSEVAANTFLLYNGEQATMNMGGLVLQFADGSQAFVNGTTVMSRDRWYHLAATWRSSDGQLIFYKDGVPERVMAAGAGLVLRGHRAYTAKIGEWGVVRSAQYKWPGMIDEAMVYKRALGSNEVASLYAARGQGVCPPAPEQFAALASLAASPGRALRVLTLNSNVAGSCNGQPMDFGSPRYSILRADLLDPVRFGPTGVVADPLELLPTVPRLSIQAMTNADVVLLHSGGFSASERALLGPFTRAGGGVLAYGNSAAGAVADLVGARAGGFSGSARATVAATDSPVTAGPFGVVGAGTVLPVGFAGAFEAGGLGSKGTALLNNDAGVFAAAFSLGAGAGRVVAFCDEELFINPPSSEPCFTAQLSETSRTLFLNAVAHVLPRRDLSAGFGLSMERVEIQGFELVSGPGGTAATESADLTLRWRAAAGRRFGIERSGDLVNWQRMAGEVVESAPGVYQVTVPVGPDRHGFYRVRSD